MSVYGNYNLLFVKGYQRVDYAAASEQSAALSPDTVAVELFSTTDCYIAIGTNPTAAAPSAESTRTAGFLLRAQVEKLVAVPKGSDSAPMKIAVIQSASAGSLDIIERSFV